MDLPNQQAEIDSSTNNDPSASSSSTTPQNIHNNIANLLEFPGKLLSDIILRRTGGKLSGSSNITFVDHSGREFFTRMRSVDLEYFFKAKILAGVKAQLLRKAEMDAEEAAGMFANDDTASSSNWTNSKHSRIKPEFLDDDTSQPVSEGSSSSSSSPSYNLAASLKLIEKKHDLPGLTSSFRRSPGSSANRRKISESVDLADSSNGQRRRTSRIEDQFPPKISKHFSLACDEVLGSDEEMRATSSSKNKVSKSSSLGSTPSAIKGTKFDLPSEKKRKIKPKQSFPDMPAPLSESVSVMSSLPSEKMPPKLKVRKNRGRGNRCRKVYGISRKELWCKSCQWKKRCARFDEDGNNIDGTEEPLPLR